MCVWGVRAGVRVCMRASMCVCIQGVYVCCGVCVCVCVHASVRACVCVHQLCLTAETKLEIMKSKRRLGEYTPSGRPILASGI